LIACRYNQVMAFDAKRVRKWFALGAIGMVALVAAFYLYARWRTRAEIKRVQTRLHLDIQQSAEGFSVSKSERGRTLFTVRARAAKQHPNGRASLHDVKIII